MKDRTLLFSALVACCLHAGLLFLNLGMTPPSLASAETTIEVTLVGPPESPAEVEALTAPVPPRLEPEPPEIIEPPTPPEPEPIVEPAIEPELVPAPEPVREIEIAVEPETSQVIVEAQPIITPVESTPPGRPTAQPQRETAATMPEPGRQAGAAVAPLELPPACTFNPKPAYPRAARRLGQEGEVMLLVEVLASGRVGKIDIEKSSGYDILDDAAVKAVRKWRFAPARKGKTPVNAWVRVPVEFNLKERQ